jgi:hypothetical protein
MAGGMGAAIPTPVYEDSTSCNGNASVTCTKITATYNFVSVVNILGWGTVQMNAVAQAVRVQ